MTETVLHVRLPAEVVEQLDTQAGREMRTRSSMARVILAAGVRQRWSQNPPAFVLPRDEEDG